LAKFELQTVATHHRSCAEVRQVLDFVEGSGLLRKQATPPQASRIKGLAAFWAGSAQCYPQAAWKDSKGLSNQGLGGFL
jgi:hypothetical protein